MAMLNLGTIRTASDRNERPTPHRTKSMKVFTTT
jgi:hypothetical protein